MLERLNQWRHLNAVLRLVSFALGALVLYQLARLAIPRTRALADFRPADITAFASAGKISTNRAITLPPEVSARIEQIRSSQVLGQVITPPRPQMALFGIAGDYAMIRGTDGQTGLLREGETLGGVKLLKIGTNRVLVENDGQTKELMLFEGFGGEPLLPKTNAVSRKDK